MQRLLRVVVGLAIWLAAITLGWWCMAGRGERSIVQPHLAPQLWDYATVRPWVAELKFDGGCYAAYGDPVFVVDGPDSSRQIGEVSRVSRTKAGFAGEAIFYSTAPELRADAKLTIHQPPESIEWVLRTMLPEEKRRQICYFEPTVWAGVLMIPSGPGRVQNANLRGIHHTNRLMTYSARRFTELEMRSVWCTPRK